MVHVDPALQSGVGFDETAFEGATRPPTEERSVARSNKTLNLAMPRMKRSLRGEQKNENSLNSLTLHYLEVCLHATELLEQGEQLHVVAERIGHRDAMVTATIYAHVTNRQAETASQRFASAFSNA
jgi:site-specific recombinase XerD